MSNLITITQESFDAAFSRGREIEKKVARICYEYGWRVAITNSGNSHDIVVSFDNRTERVEVKNEDNYSSSGNIMVECYQGQNKKASGISVSKAFVCIHTLKDMAVLYQTLPMREWLLQMDMAFPVCPIARSDNGNHGRKVSIRSLILSDREWNDYTEIENIPMSRVWFWRAS